MTQAAEQPVEVNHDGALFLACYRVADGGVGGLVLTLHLTVDTSTKRITGFGYVTQTTNPPLRLPTELRGRYSELALQGHRLIIVTATGYPHDSTGFILPNLQLSMALEDWKSGTAEYEYRINVQDPQWQVLKDIPAISISCD